MIESDNVYEIKKVTRKLDKLQKLSKLNSDERFSKSKFSSFYHFFRTVHDPFKITWIETLKRKFV